MSVHVCGGAHQRREAEGAEVCDRGRKRALHRESTFSLSLFPYLMLARGCLPLVVVLTNLVSCKLMLSLRLTTRHRLIARRAPSHLRTRSHMHAHTSGGVFVNGGEASFQGCSQDGNSIGRFASELLDQIQTRRQETYYSQNGFGAPYQYLNPLAIS